MKRFVLIAALLAYNPFLLNAREVNNPNESTTPDAWSVAGDGCYSATAVAGGISGGVNGCEVAVDYLGNFVPTVGYTPASTSTQTLGTASLPWAQIFVASMTVTSGGTIGTPGTANALGTGNASGPQGVAFTGNPSFGESTIGGSGGAVAGIYVSTTIPVIAPFELLQSSGSAIVITSIPSISTRTVSGGGAPLPEGTFLVLGSSSTASITLQDQGTLAGSQLALGSATRVISKTKTLTLIWEGLLGRWEEIAYGNNQGN
jgi:hypothetical protein